MSRKALVLGSIMALGLAVSLLVAPSISRADTITITEISVTVGTTTWCGSSTGTCTGNNIWSTGLGSGITLLAGESLILTQTGYTASGVQNFDSSENGGATTGALLCNSNLGSGNPVCNTTLSINGSAPITPTGTSKDNLANNNNDIGDDVHNEAVNWGPSVATFGPSNFGQVYFGYADNLHSGSCADSSDNNCLPNTGSAGVAGLFDGTTNGGTRPTYFIGTGINGNTLVRAQNTDGFHCSVTSDTDTCYDSGAILIYNTQPVPEPVTMFLGGTGLLLLGYAARRRLFAR